MTFAIPPGQLKYARRLAPVEEEEEGKFENGKAGDTPTADENAEGNDAKHNGAEDITAKVDHAEDIEVKSNKDQDSNVETENTQAKLSDPSHIEGKRTTPKPCDAEAPSMARPSPAPSSQLSAIPSDVDDVVLASITTLQALEEKIVTIDGRLGKKVDGNAFKCIRVKRNNQDLGSLFEIREEWYVYKN